MKNKYTLIFLLALFSQTAYAQSLRLSQHRIMGIADTVQYGSVVNVSYTLVNEFDIPYSDTITTWLKTNFNNTPLKIGAAYRSIAGGDSTTITASFTATSPYFEENLKNIIVVWPTGTGTIIYSGDSIKRAPFIIGNVNINKTNSALKYVRFYPNPATDLLSIENQKSGIFIKDILITDVHGRRQNVILYPDNTIELKHFSKGLYMLKINFSDGKQAVYKVIKAE